MKIFVKLLLILHVVALCRAQLVALPVQNHASLCTGDSASLQLAIEGSQGNTAIVWSHGKSLLEDSERYSLGQNATLLNIKNALPPHAGKYYASVTDGVTAVKAAFSVEVNDIFVHTLVKSPVKIAFGEKGTLSVEKSTEGKLWWIHQGKVLKGQDSHYKFMETDDRTKAQLEIMDFGKEQEGLYEVVLKKEACEVRNIVEVRLTGEWTESKLSQATDSEASSALDFSEDSYILPAILVPAIILIVALAYFIKKKSQKHGGSPDEVNVKPVNHVYFDKPIYGVQDRVFPTYDITPITSSHPQSSSLGKYSGVPKRDGNDGTYGNAEDLYGTYGSIVGSSVQPHSSGNNQIYGTIHEDYSDYYLKN